MTESDASKDPDAEFSGLLDSLEDCARAAGLEDRWQPTSFSPVFAGGGDPVLYPYEEVEGRLAVAAQPKNLVAVVARVREMMTAITEMRLCEASRVVLHAGRLYRFTVAPGCRMCEVEAGMVPRTEVAESSTACADRTADAVAASGEVIDRGSHGSPGSSEYTDGWNDALRSMRRRDPLGRDASFSSEAGGSSFDATAKMLVDMSINSNHVVPSFKAAVLDALRMIDSGRGEIDADRRSEIELVIRSWRRWGGERADYALALDIMLQEVDGLPRSNVRYPSLRRGALGGESGAAVIAGLASVDRGKIIDPHSLRELIGLAATEIDDDNCVGFTDLARDEVRQLLRDLGLRIAW